VSYEDTLLIIYNDNHITRHYYDEMLSGNCE